MRYHLRNSNEAGRVEFTEDEKCVHMLVGQPESNRPIGWPRQR